MADSGISAFDMFTPMFSSLFVKVSTGAANLHPELENSKDNIAGYV